MFYPIGIHMQTFLSVDPDRMQSADSARITELGLAMIRHTTLSGVQQKLSMSLVAGRLVVTTGQLQATHILKPPSAIFAYLPENEAVTMRLMALAKVAVPPSGLVPMADGKLAYVVRRFDRPGTPRKLALEDFCQLAELPLKDKYAGSMEQCAQLVRRYTGEPVIQLARFYRMVLASWWVGNEDLHRKNLGLLRTADGRIELAPAYDVVSSRLYLDSRDLALPVNGVSLSTCADPSPGQTRSSRSTARNPPLRRSHGISSKRLTVARRLDKPKRWVQGMKMPTVLRSGGFDMVIRTADHGPPHVHVFKAKTQAKIALGPVSVLLDNMAPKDLVRAVRLVEDNADTLLARWREIHG